MSRNTQVGGLLRAAEKGSPTHIGLLENQWPRGIQASEQAISVILRHLEAGIPMIHDISGRLSSGRFEFAYSEVWDTLSLTRACFSALKGAFDFINKEASDSQVQRMFSIIIPSIDSVVSWCDFFARNSGLVFPDRARDYGYHCSSLTLTRLLEKGAPFLAETDTLEKIVDLILWIWTFGVDPYESRGVVLSPSDYEWRASRRNGCLSEALNENQPTRDITLKKINAMGRRSQKRLAKVFCSRVNEWVAVHEHLHRQNPAQFDGRYFTYICVIAQELARVESFCRALTDCEFWHLLITTALKFRSAPPPTTAADVDRGSLAAEVAFYVFMPHRQSAHDILRIMPQCVDAGIVEIFVDDLLRSQSEETSRFTWNDERVADPLCRLYALSHYPGIIRAVMSAVSALPKEKVIAILSSPVTADPFKKFVANLEDFKQTAKSLESGDTPRFCDCLRHEDICPHLPSTGAESESSSSVLSQDEVTVDSNNEQMVSEPESEPGSTHGSDSDKVSFTPKQCSGCHTVVYCSRECQKEDWKTFHKFECPSSRAHRFQLQLSGFRICHQTRMFYLRNLASIVTSLTAIKRPHQHQHCCEPEVNPAYLLDARDMPLKWSTIEADDILTWTDEALIPKNAPGPIPIFDDARSRAMVDDSNRYEDTHIVCSIALLGNYLVATMGKFVFSEKRSDSGGSDDDTEKQCQPHGPYDVYLLGGTVKVVELDRSRT